MAEFGLQFCSKEYEIRKKRPKQLKSVIVRVIGFILKPVTVILRSKRCSRIKATIKLLRPLITYSTKTSTVLVVIKL